MTLPCAGTYCHCQQPLSHQYSREFLSLVTCVKYKVIPSIQGQGQGPPSRPRPRPQPKPRPKTWCIKAKAKDKDFGIKDQGQGLTSRCITCWISFHWQSSLGWSRLRTSHSNTGTIQFTDDKPNVARHVRLNSQPRNQLAAQPVVAATEIWYICFKRKANVCLDWWYVNCDTSSGHIQTPVRHVCFQSINALQYTLQMYILPIYILTVP